MEDKKFELFKRGFPRLCYHGTDRKGLDGIMDTGFKKGSYFAYNLEDAIGYGGQYVLSVWFDLEGFNGGDPDSEIWQFRCFEKIDHERIQKVVKYESTVVYEKEVESKGVGSISETPQDGERTGAETN